MKNKELKNMNIDNENYPMIIGGRYKFHANDSFYNKEFDGVIGILVKVSIESNDIGLKLEQTLFSWNGSYEAFKFYWKLVKD